MSRVARLTAGAVMAAADTTIDDLDDVKIIVSEVIGALIDHGAGEDITIRLEVAGGMVHIHGATTAMPQLDLQGPELELCRTVLSAIADSYDLTVASQRLMITATKPLDA